MVGVAVGFGGVCARSYIRCHAGPTALGVVELVGRSGMSWTLADMSALLV